MKSRRIPSMMMSLLVMVALAGCDWSAGGDSDFNTSRGAGVNVNISGVYHGNLPGGRAVSQTSHGNITQLTIMQSGNKIEVVDNQGSRYRGTVGSPGAVAEPDSSGTYPAGVELVQYQLSFEGKDEVAAKDISFVGVIHVVAVQDITGSASTQYVGSAQTNSYTVVDSGQTNIVTEIITPLPGGGSQTVTITIDGETGEEISRTVTTSEGESEVRVFELTEANSQYRMEGTWVEEAGLVADVDALSAGSGGTVTTGGSSE